MQVTFLASSVTKIFMTPLPTNSKSKFDLTVVIKTLLAYEVHWILMVELFVLGILAAVVGYVFARPSYLSTCVIKAYRYLDSTQTAMQPAGGGVSIPLRAIGGNMETPYVILEAGKRIGLAGPKTTYRGFRDDVVPKVRIGYLDGDLIEMTIEAFSPTAVEELPKALIEVYESNRAKIRMEMREKAVQKYMDELAVMRERVSKQLDARLKFEEESAIATTQVELEHLSDVPVQIVKLRHRREEMELTRQVLIKQGEKLGTIGQLALLTSNSNGTTASGTSLETGRLVRSNANGPVTFKSPDTTSRTEVVVQPAMVEGLVPWKNLEKRKRTLEEQLRMDSTKYREDHQGIKDLKEEIKKVESALELELSVARQAFEIESAQVKAELEQYEAKLPEYHKVVKNYDEKRLGYDLMQRSQLAWDNAYEKLAKQIEGLELDGLGSPVNLELKGFTEMRNVIPVSPSRSKLATLGLLIGIGAALGVPFLMRQTDSSVNSLEEFTTTIGLRGIGLIPRTDEAVLQELNRSPAIGAMIPNALLENFRLIRSSILLSPSPSGEEKVIMVTSARPGEGKSTIACNTGWAFASIGEKTLVIDCDLRRGRVANIAGVDNETGLTTTLIGQTKFEDCLKKSSAVNLWVLPRGPIIQGTTELLNTPTFANLLEQLKKQFTRIILDTPPVLGLSETAFLQNYAAGILLVVRAQKTPRKDVVEAVETLRKLDAYFYGFVLNDVDFSKRLNSYQYYYYSSNYYDLNWEAGEEGNHPTTNDEKSATFFSDRS